jgi:hypothetical protein
MDRPKPGDFPIGSPESRAAARMQAVNRQDTRSRVEYVSHLQRSWRGEGAEPQGWGKERHSGEWQGCGEKLMRVVHEPFDEVKSLD